MPLAPLRRRNKCPPPPPQGAQSVCAGLESGPLAKGPPDRTDHGIDSLRFWHHCPAPHPPQDDPPRYPPPPLAFQNGAPSGLFHFTAEGGGGDGASVGRGLGRCASPQAVHRRWAAAVAVLAGPPVVAGPLRRGAPSGRSCVKGARGHRPILRGPGARGRGTALGTPSPPPPVPLTRSLSPPTAGSPDTRASGNFIGSYPPLI